MRSYVVKMQKGGRLTIPAAIRSQLNLKPGDWLELKASLGRIICKPTPSHVKAKLPR